MQISRPFIAGVLLLVLLASLAGCTDLRPAERSDGVLSPPPEVRIQTPTPITLPAPAAPPEAAAGGTADPTAAPVPERPEPILPVGKPTPVAKTFQTEPLVQVTGDQWESFATWPQYPFEYRSLGYIIWTPYNTAAYEQAKKSVPARNEERSKELSQLQTISPDWWYLALPLPGQEEYYRALISEPANDMVYDSILSRLREIRDQHQLDDNEYAELIARFVQRAVPDREWADEGRVVERYPIETIGDLGGNRNDKSLLLAGLLAREGYGTALIYFPNVDRMIVGIRGDGKAPDYDGYYGIDPSTETFFGVYAPKAAMIIPAVQYFSDYQVIGVSDGRRFTAGTELRVIWDRLLLLRSFESVRDYLDDLRFVSDNRDDRQLVFEYLAWLGPFA